MYYVIFNPMAYFRIPEPKPRELPPLPSLDLSSQRMPLLTFEHSEAPDQCDADAVTSAQQMGAADATQSSTFWPNASQVSVNE